MVDVFGVVVVSVMVRHPFVAAHRLRKSIREWDYSPSSVPLFIVLHDLLLFRLAAADRSGLGIISPKWLLVHSV